MKKKLKLADGWFYDGEVSKNNDPHGKGTLINKTDNSKYIGEFKNGLRHGLGTVFLGDGLKLTGKWKNSQLPKSGTYEYPSGQLYEGNLKDGKFHGKGKLTLPDGSIIIALFEDSKIIKELKKYDPIEIDVNKILKSIKFIIQNLKPKQMINGKWVFKKPNKAILSKIKSNEKLSTILQFFIAEDFARFPFILKKCSLKYNYKLK